MLAAAGLDPCATRCVQHSEPVKLSCTTCREPSLCVLCGLSKHPGHALLVLVEAAPVARGLLRDAAAGAMAPGKTAVDAARQSAQLLAAELDALPSRVGVAELRIDELRDSLIAAATSRHAILRAELRDAAATAEAALRAELARSDGLLEQITAVSSELDKAAKVLCDADVVAHADTLIDRSTGIRTAIAALPPRPATAAFISCEVSARAALNVIAGLGRIAVAHDESPPDGLVSSVGAIVAPLSAPIAAFKESVVAPTPPQIPCAAAQVCAMR